MKNVKISLLAAGALMAIVACSSLEVDNPTSENFPNDWSAAEFIKANPDLRALQIRDKVTYMNAVSGAEKDDDAFIANEEVVKALMIKHGGMTEADFDISVHGAYIKKFNIYGVENESAIFDTLTLDTAIIERQFIAYGAIEGRPYRFCKDSDANLVPKCESTQADESPNVGFVGHLYCAKDGAVYCLDCEPEASGCPDNFVPEESSSSAAAPESSETAGDESSSSEGEGGETADSSSSEGGENPESSDASADSSSSEEAAAESSSSAE
jgi:hypothetical protein